MTQQRSTRIYLASRSPRRRELLKQIGVAFELLLFRESGARGADVDEAVRPGENADDYVRRVCREKAATAWLRIEERRLRRQPVLAADTTVCIDGRILGKPSDTEDAARLLAALSGREHRVLSAVTIQYGNQVESAFSESFVRFRDLDAGEIARYVESGEPMDKAGAYAIQGRAAAFVSHLRGSYSGVMGLPLYETSQLLERFREVLTS
jgi:septum formation protein